MYLLKWQQLERVCLLFSYSYAVSSKIEPFYKGGKVQVRLIDLSTRVLQELVNGSTKIAVLDV